MDVGTTSSKEVKCEIWVCSKQAKEDYMIYKVKKMSVRYSLKKNKIRNELRR